MPDTNGKARWIHYLVGLVVTLLIIAITTIGNNVIANDKAGRDRDITLDNKIDNAIIEQKQINAIQAVQLAEIRKDNEWILKGIEEIKKAVQ